MEGDERFVAIEVMSAEVLRKTKRVTGFEPSRLLIKLIKRWSYVESHQNPFCVREIANNVARRFGNGPHRR